MKNSYTNNKVYPLNDILTPHNIFNPLAEWRLTYAVYGKHFVFAFLMIIFESKPFQIGSF